MLKVVLFTERERERDENGEWMLQEEVSDDWGVYIQDKKGL